MGTLKQAVDRVTAAKTAIGNAITAKGGTVAAGDGLEEYAADIATIPSGGITPAEPKDVNFYDYDGTCVYSYTADEFSELTEMPANPTHAGLTAQGWNWSLVDAKAYVAKYDRLIIGQMYITDDGATRLYVSITDGRLNKFISCAVNGTLTIDWGDGTTPDTVTGSSTTSSSIVDIAHNYAKAGDYCINLSALGQYQFNLNKSPSKDSLKFNVVSANIGANCAAGPNMFINCINMISLTLPKNIGSMWGSCIRFCRALNHLTLPIGSSSNDSYCLAGSALKTLSFPKEYRLGTATCEGCLFLEISAPEVTGADTRNTFQNNTSLTSFTFPDTITKISYWLNGCASLGFIKFTSTTPPSVTAAAEWNNIPSDCYVLVPLNTLDDYLNETNMPDDSTYLYLCYAKYASGAELPATSTDGYTLTWYASREDARAGTNPITVGNGKEVYAVGV